MTEREVLEYIYDLYGTLIVSVVVLPFTDSIIAGLICRESNGGLSLTPTGPEGTGDNGHGRGLCQIDDRAFPAYCKTDSWKDPRSNITFCVDHLSWEFRKFKQHQAGSDEDCIRYSLAGYNSGVGHVFKALKQKIDVDTYTAHSNYSNEVLRLASVYQNVKEVRLTI